MMVLGRIIQTQEDRRDGRIKIYDTNKGAISDGNRCFDPLTQFFEVKTIDDDINK